MIIKKQHFIQKIFMPKDNNKIKILKNVKMFYNNGDIFLGDLEANYPYKN